MSQGSRVLFVAFTALTAGCASPGDPAAEDVEVSRLAVEEGHANDLTPQQEKRILGMIDSICGDTWCEGDYNYEFVQLVCDFAAKSCTLTTLLIDSTRGPTLGFVRSCEMRGISNLGDMVDVPRSGYPGLGDSFYDKVSACVGKLESSIPLR